MKKYLYLFCLLSASTLLAQEWEESYAEALTTAKEQNKNLLLVFAGSDWCGPCKKLDRDVWSSEAFRTYAEANFVLYKADFPRKKSNRLPEAIATENGALAEKYNPKGYFPLVVVLDAGGGIIGKTGYRNDTPQEYIEHLRAMQL